MDEKFITVIKEKFVSTKINSLELPVNFKNSIPKSLEGLTVSEFLEKLDFENNKLIGCGKKSLDLFRLYLEANCVIWENYKIRKIFRENRLRRGIFTRQNMVLSQDFKFIYQKLHDQRIRFEPYSSKQLTLFDSFDLVDTNY